MTGKEDILLIGGGGHCKACIDVIEEEGIFSIKGIIDLPEKVGQKILGYSVIDSDENLEKLLKKTRNVLITTGHIKYSELRVKLFKQVKNARGFLPVIISPKAQVSRHTKIGEGSIIMHGVVINANTKIGKNCIINNLSLVEHDVVVGDHVHVSTGSRINGNCKIGNDSFIGSGSIVNHGVKIRSNIVIGSGSLVLRDIDKIGIYVGNPLMKIG